MKKLFLILIIAPVLGFGQVLTDILYFDVEQQIPKMRKYPSDYQYLINGEVKEPYTENSNDFNFFTVPDGKLWQVKKYQTYDTYRSTDFSNYNNLGFSGDVRYKRESSSDNDYYSLIFLDNDYFTNNNMFSVYPNSHNLHIPFNTASFQINNNFFLTSGTKFTFNSNYFRVIIYEYSFDGNSLSYNEPETIKNNSNTPVLFPNPTSSLLALNSDKEYDIEVYDMAGNKVMALTGNTIDMSHLSSATYIVKALDKVDNEEVSYKVVKN